MKIKKSRRIISLILALTMIFTFMAMSASAATTEVQPRASYCPQCGGLGFQYWYTQYLNDDPYHTYTPTSRGNCTAGPATHVHYLLPAYIHSRCATCQYKEKFYTTSAAYCPYGGNT